jgi:cell wall assembly regulator SMI1
MRKSPSLKGSTPQIVVSTLQDIAARDMRAEKTREATCAPDMRKMLPKHDFEISDDAAVMRGLFWNPTDVADIAWRELINKLSAVAAVAAAAGDQAAGGQAGDQDAEPRPLKKMKAGA